jgi:hypothetical protein
MKKQDIYEKLGKRLIGCNFDCAGIKNNKKAGYFPRLLFIEKGNKKGKKAIIIGLNPGKCNAFERDWIIKDGNYWENQKDYYQNNLNKWPYFRRVKELLTILGYEGDVLWTNLVKCECDGRNGYLPPQTLRTCINKFLKYEINNLLPSADIFCMGRQSWEICSVAFPNNFIVGLPHPSGPHSSNKFLNLLKLIKKDRQGFIKLLRNKKDENNQILAIKL